MDLNFTVACVCTQNKDGTGPERKIDNYHSSISSDGHLRYTAGLLVDTLIDYENHGEIPSCMRVSLLWVRKVEHIYAAQKGKGP